MNTCILCGKETEGSVGAAGIKWSRICQPCKDEEDQVLASRIEADRRVFNMVFKSIGVKI